MRELYCSCCGATLTTQRMAIPHLGAIAELVNPHECREEPEDIAKIIGDSMVKQQTTKPKPRSASDMLNSMNSPKEGFPFADKLRKSTSEIESVPTDQRPPRDEITSSAPPGVFSGALSNKLTNKSEAKDPRTIGKKEVEFDDSEMGG